MKPKTEFSSLNSSDDQSALRLRELLASEGKKQIDRPILEYRRQMAPYAKKLQKTMTSLQADEPAITRLADEILLKYPEPHAYETTAVKKAVLALRREAQAAKRFVSNNLRAMSVLLHEITDGAAEHTRWFTIGAMLEQDIRRAIALLNSITAESFSGQIARLEAAFAEAVKKAAGAVAPLPSTSGPPVSEEKEARIIRNVEPGD